MPESSFQKWYQSGTGGYSIFETLAGEESRTPDLQLGKLSLYRLSYTRRSNLF